MNIPKAFLLHVLQILDIQKSWKMSGDLIPVCFCRIPTRINQNAALNSRSKRGKSIGAALSHYEEIIPPSPCLWRWKLTVLPVATDTSSCLSCEQRNSEERLLIFLSSQLSADGASETFSNQFRAKKTRAFSLGRGKAQVTNPAMTSSSTEPKASLCLHFTHRWGEKALPMSQPQKSPILQQNQGCIHRLTSLSCWIYMQQQNHVRIK